MDNPWYSNQAGLSNDYVQNQGWLTTPQRQDDQENWDDVGAWNQSPYDDVPNNYGGFCYDGLPSPDKEVKEQTGDTKNGSCYKALIHNQEHYFMEKESRVQADLHEKKADGVVSGAPESDEMKRYWVGRLFEAFKNTVDIKDKNCKNGKPAQSAQRLASNYYPDKEIEIVCWKILMACSDSQYGVKLVEGHHHTKWENNDVHKTFEDRMEKIIEVCKSSKAMCKQLLDPPYYMRLVDAPGFEASLKENNKRINSERDVQNEIGRKAMKKGIDLTTLPDIKTEDEKEGEEEEEEDANKIAESSPPAAKTPKNRRILPAKRQSSAKASSKKRAPSVQSPVTPVSTGKRKQRSMTAKDYKEDDEEEEESDGSQYEYEEDETPTRKTPSKRATTRASRAKVATPSKSTTSRATSRRVTPGSIRATPSKPASKGALGSLPVRKQATHDSTVEHRNPQSIFSPITQAPSLGDENRLKYKEIICDILQVDRAVAQNYSLEDLRFYARAYNNEFATDDWFLGTADEATGRMFRVITESGIILHFAQVLPHFVPLAIARGDLNSDKTVNNHSPHMIGFATNGDIEKNMALGVYPNPFGLHDQLWNLGPQ